MLAATASAQDVSGREAWQQRERWLSERHARVVGQMAPALARSTVRPRSVVTGHPAVLLPVRRFADNLGNLVIVGEVQNNSASTLFFAQVTVDFFDGSNVHLGTESTYVLGSENRRIFTAGIPSGVFTVLPPGAVGFFKVWTDIPDDTVRSFTFGSGAEIDLPSTAPKTSLARTGEIQLTVPPVCTIAGAAIDGTTCFRFNVTNTGTETAAYLVQASLAGYQGGSIADVSTAFARQSALDQCGVPPELRDTAIRPGATGLVNYFFLRPVTDVPQGRLVFEWDEVGVSPAVFNAPSTGGPGHFSVFSQCPWTAVSDVNWITITGGASGNGDGDVSFSVAPNPTGSARSASLSIAGLTVVVNQAAVTVPPSITSDLVNGVIDWYQSTTLSISAAGSAPLSYQWYIGSRGDTANPIAGATSASYTTPRLAATTRYWVRVSNPSGAVDSNLATITVNPAFTNDALNGALVKVTHIQELRTAIGTLRAAFDVGPFAWTDPSLTPGSTLIKAIHVSELRAALAAVYVKRGLPPPSYTDPALSGVVIKAMHIIELRNAIRAME